MKWFSAVVGLVVLGQVAAGVQAQVAQISVSCSKIADATERLACFDKTFPNTDGGQVRSTRPVQPGAIVSQPVAPQVDQAPVVVEDNRGKRVGSPFTQRDQVDISSQLKSVRDKDKQKMVFLLENDQIWLQESPRSLPFDEGDEIKIKSAKLGGYMLSNERGVATRVRRIK